MLNSLDLQRRQRKRYKLIRPGSAQMLAEDEEGKHANTLGLRRRLNGMIACRGCDVAYAKAFANAAAVEALLVEFHMPDDASRLTQRHRGFG